MSGHDAIWWGRGAPLSKAAKEAAHEATLCQCCHTLERPELCETCAETVEHMRTELMGGCLVCHGSLTGKRHHAVYCSPACREKAYRRRGTVTPRPRSVTRVPS
jgi:recombinational DNA repair protein RecR